MNDHQDRGGAAGRPAGRKVLPCFHWGLVFCVLAMLTAAAPVTGEQTAAPVDAVQAQAGFDHVVEKGDTLWDLSRRYAGSAADWPRIWKHNNQIPNPHRIFPGDRIRLWSRPALAPAVPPRARASSRPPETPADADPSVYRYPGIEAVGFIRPQPVAPAATITRLPEDKTIAGQWESVRVRPSEGTILFPGQQLVVFRVLEGVMDKADKEFIGYPHYLLGIVEIAAVSGEWAEAEVLHSFREMRLGDKLMPRLKLAAATDIVLADAPPGIAGKILRAEEDRVIFGDQAVVFINRGRSDGVGVGQRYAIFDPSSPVEDPGALPAAIGSLLVLRVENETATALVTRSSREISPGAPIISAASKR